MASEPSLETMRSRIYDPVLYPSQPNLIGDLRSDAMRLLDEIDRLRESLATLRSAWNAHMETCPQHAALPDLPTPTWAELEAWRNAPSNTAPGGVLVPNPSSETNAKEGAE